jgi:hypothetical protein
MARAGKTPIEEGFTTKWKTLMNIRTLSAIALLAAAVSSPVFAQETATSAQRPAHALRPYRGVYNQVPTPRFVAPRAGAYGESNFDASFDRSRVGDHDPDFNPPGT